MNFYSLGLWICGFVGLRFGRLGLCVSVCVVFAYVVRLCRRVVVWLCGCVFMCDCAFMDL